MTDGGAGGWGGSSRPPGAPQAPPARPPRRPPSGSPRGHAELRAEGVRVGRKRVARLMRRDGLAVARRRRRVPRTTASRPDPPGAPTLLDRNFAAERPDTVWLADLSYIPTGEGWLCLAAIKDLAT